MTTPASGDKVRIPAEHQAVLADALQSAIGGRSVRAAVFTTFSFDPAFFEEHALAALFGHAFSTESRVKLAQLEAALKDSGPVSVYYDAAALQEGTVPPVLDVRRFDVRWKRGAFHPKVVLVLVDDPRTSDRVPEGARHPLELIVLAASANLTQQGWWENVEGGHVGSIRARDSDGNPTIRAGVLELVGLLENLSEGKDAALSLIGDFIRRQAATDATKWKSYRTFFPRLYAGSSNFISWIESLQFNRGGWNLEVISPFLDEGDPSTLRALLEAVDPRACRIALPIDRATGRAAISRAYHEGLVELRKRFDIRWADLPEDVRAHAKATKSRAETRRGVHAKVYRLWHEEGKRSVTVVGSVNLTSSGTVGSRSGNVEVAFLVEGAPAAARIGWWLELRPEEPSEFVEVIEREDEIDERPIAVSIQFDWHRKLAEVRFEEDLPNGIAVTSRQGEPLFSLAEGSPAADRAWTKLADASARALEAQLRSSSLVYVSDGARKSTILVREEGWFERPSVVLKLTPEEILLYWSLLSPDQQAEFIADRMPIEGALDSLGLRVDGRGGSDPTTFFDRCAGLYHAFESLRTSIERALAAGRPEEAFARLYGEKYDSIPVLLDRVAERVDADPVQAYLTCLCAKQLDHEFKRPLELAAADGRGALDRGAIRAARKRLAVDRIDAMLPKLEARLIDGVCVTTDFMEWIRDAFVRRITPRTDCT